MLQRSSSSIERSFVLQASNLAHLARREGESSVAFLDREVKIGSLEVRTLWIIVAASGLALLLVLFACCCCCCCCGDRKSKKTKSLSKGRYRELDTGAAEFDSKKLLRPAPSVHQPPQPGEPQTRSLSMRPHRAESLDSESLYSQDTVFDEAAFVSGKGQGYSDTNIGHWQPMSDSKVDLPDGNTTPLRTPTPPTPTGLTTPRPRSIGAETLPPSYASAWGEPEDHPRISRP